MSIPRIPAKFHNEHISHGIKKNAQKLFEYFVRKMIISGSYADYLTHNQLSNLIFKEKDSVELKKITQEYKQYFEYKGQKKRLLVDRVYEDHPQIWGENIEQDIDIKQAIQKAIDDEIRETRTKEKSIYVDVFNIEKQVSRGSLYVYNATVKIEGESVLSFNEGLIVALKIGNTKLYVTVLDFDSINEVITFQSSKEINRSNGKIQFSTLNLLYKLKDAVTAISLYNSPIIADLLENKDIPKVLNNVNIHPWQKQLDSSQMNCITQSLNHNLTYIWGPPGTGKTHTLGQLLINLYNSGEKTLVCSIANVAVDGLLKKMIDFATGDYYKDSNKDVFAEKKIVRLGYAQSDEIRNMEALKFENATLINLSNQIQTVEYELHNSYSTEDPNYPILLSRRDELKKKYDIESAKFLNEAKIVFATASKVIVESIFRDVEFDNLVIDEGSMMAIPHLFVLAAKTKRRIIIAGDFKQLGPIAISKSEYAQKFLHKDLFSLLSKHGNESEIIHHPALSMLTEQRRSHHEIAKLINSPFYNGRLKTVSNIKHGVAKNIPPEIGHIVFVDLSNKASIQAKFTKGHSKYNASSRDVVMDIIKRIIEANSSIRSLGVITPYKQQVSDYKKNLENLPKTNFDIKVGTIHTFQGSESDVIILDIVDTLNQENGIGRLYKGKTGERLINVAISRAISKLIIVGNKRIFNECNGGDLVSSELKEIMRRASKACLIHLC
jgi:superfamily I DNA and/or RNA helicase